MKASPGTTCLGRLFCLSEAPSRSACIFSLTEGGTDMLVLTRRVGEEIVIDGGISIAVLSIKGGQIRLGITAPRSVGVQRQELLVRAKEIGADVASWSRQAPRLRGG